MFQNEDKQKYLPSLCCFKRFIIMNFLFKETYNFILPFSPQFQHSDPNFLENDLLRRDIKMLLQVYDK